ncbi:hypothetical protein [Streptomyces sp. NPDC059272]|uniref:hypothetical protein n=1 Tax=Streptomyces sp. NPDC059272 TaxID=3346800 RepID=UPI0036A6E6E0
MGSTPRTRFSVRVGLAQAVDDDAPYDGVPDHLVEPLQTWIEESVGDIRDETFSRAVCLRLRIPVAPRSTPTRAITSVQDVALLDVVDILLAVRQDFGWAGDPGGRLARILVDGGSAYRVNDATNGLEVVIDPAVREAVKQTIADAAQASNAGSAADHLAAAWKAAYGRQPDPERAYSEAIKAAEAAAHDTIEPRNAKATLGTMLGVIRNAPAKFDTALSTPAGKEPIVPVEAMMRALWEGQTSRHGARTTTVPETLEAARAGFHLAATIVQLFTSGAVTKQP